MFVFRKNSQKSKSVNQIFPAHMIVLAALIGYLVGWFLWKFYIEKEGNFDVKIPESSNKNYSIFEPQKLSANLLANELEKADGKPVLIYLYATWCSACERNFINFNEIAREFQSTDLQVFSIAIDKGISAEELQSYHLRHKEIYFLPYFLTSKDGFAELLKKIDVNYRGSIPFTILLNRQGLVAEKFAGIKSKKFLRRKIIEQIYKIEESN